MLVLLARYPKSIAWFFTALIYVELLLTPLGTNAAGRYIPVNVHATAGWQSYFENPYRGMANIPAKPEAGVVSGTAAPRAAQPLQKAGLRQADAFYGGGPTQPEMQAFSSINNANMVDLFSGDFSYTIPLMDVGGYPITLGYRAGISMDQEASWVGLGWNINPGTISRSLRGLPDDFSGDSVKKVMNVKEEKTIGVTAGADLETWGTPFKVGASIGVKHNNYKGWGIERAINASINSGLGVLGGLNAGLSITNSSMDGLTIDPTIGWAPRIAALNSTEASFSLSTSYNSRTGIKSLQMGLGLRQYMNNGKNQGGTMNGTLISFNTPTFTPEIQIPYTSRQFSFTGKVGLEKRGYHPSLFVSGYVSTQGIASKDTLLELPSFGYLHFQDGAGNSTALLDYNREKELPYREKPAVPHIAVPSYTYDAFSITGEGTGGMFRAYRSDIGFVYDHFMRTKDASDRVSIDLGVLPDLSHSGIDLNINRAFTQYGPWLEGNPLKNVINFRKNANFFEAAYFRNPGEKSINSKPFYETLGGDDVVTVGLYQQPSTSSHIYSTNYLSRYRNKRLVGSNLLTPQNAIKQERDKRTQVINFLTAKEADAAGLDKYIENYTMNVFDSTACGPMNIPVEPYGTGMPAEYFNNIERLGKPIRILQNQVPKMARTEDGPPNVPGIRPDYFSVRWVGRLKAPVTGKYTFSSASDDGFAIRLNDRWVIVDWRPRSLRNPPVTGSVNLVAGEFYEFEAGFFNDREEAELRFQWSYDGKPLHDVPAAFLYPPAVDTFEIYKPGNPNLKLLVKEKRVNRFRKPNHISEITVLNNDGRRYVYGIPVYNLKQKEATFAVNGRDSGNRQTGIVKYKDGVDNTAGGNRNGKDWYFNSTETPAYAHSFLLTGILSADYSDLTGNGISDDDIGDAVKFNYSKICGINNPFKWRAPAVEGSTANFNEGLRTDYRDDKGSYIYGEKELWYLHTIESKTMIATFMLEDRYDLPAMEEAGRKIYDGTAKRLKEINLYSKSDFAVKGTKARPIKTVHFEYAYDLCPGVNGASTAKLTLKKIWFTYNGNKKAVAGQNPYVFRYASTNPTYDLKSYDRWGSYKDPLQNPGSKVNNIITNAEYPYSLQDSAIAARNVTAWTLDSIALPSGGSIKVDYESDDYAYVQNRRAMQLCKIVGLNSTPVLPNNTGELYGNGQDYLYVFIKVPRVVTSLQDVYTGYLSAIDKLYFKLYVKMPTDKYSNGNTHEYVSCYADIEKGVYGIANPTTIWVKIRGIELNGNTGGQYSPLAKAVTQFLRLSLPSKAYPGSETGDNLDLEDAVKVLASLADNIKTTFSNFDNIARNRSWAKYIDTSRSFARLTNPYFKKLGGGHRVKKITIYDNWDKMTNQRPAVYGQEYTYTTRKEIDGKLVTISSGVANYEPGIGSDENPFHEPIQYVENVSVLGPVALGYSEEPLGESFFPAAGVGYSSVRVRTINYKNKKSANGYDETKFYTSYDYPVFTDRTMIDGDTKKRFKPAIANFLRVNARHYLNLSQGFKVELNDMHGKLRSKASYPETDPNNYTSYAEYFYRTENPRAETKRLSNIVTVMKPNGSIDTASLIGKDVELMVDMREQSSVVNGPNINLNTEMFTIPVPPYFGLIPMALNLMQREETIFRSAATTKIIQRYGILDSVVQIEKGSRISTRDMLYDSETGDVLLTRTQNEFNDPVYNFTYPSHWAYDGMGLAYKNIGVRLSGVSIREGKIVESSPAINQLFSSGDEILVAGKVKTGGADECHPDTATFPNYTKIWCIDSSVLSGGPSVLYFIDRAGLPYSGIDVDLKVIRSGRRNILGSIGAVTSLDSLIRKDPVSGEYKLSINTGSKIIAASSNEFRQWWKVEDVQLPQPARSCLPNWQPSGELRCVKDGSGNNTGYQEMEEFDMNPQSPTQGISRWTLIGLNCAECSKPAKWVLTGQIRCQLDSLGRNTGYQQKEERDTATCSATYNYSRWTSNTLNCTSCPQSPGWVPTGNVRCAKDANNNNTGYQEREERDTTHCGGDTLRWVVTIWNCTTCTQAPGWKATGNMRCAKDANGMNTGYQEREERDTTLCGSNATRWVLASLNCTACAQTPGWKPTGNIRCAKDVNNNNTGYQEREERDTTNCGGNATRWVVQGFNCTTCPKPPSWVPTSEFRCVKNTNNSNRDHNTGMRERKEIDTVCGRNDIRWVTVGQSCSSCPTEYPNWQPTNQPPGCELISVKPTLYSGYLVQEYRDMSTCSDSSNMTKYLRTVLDCDHCYPAPPEVCPNCTPGNCQDELGRKCINGACTEGTLVCVESVPISGGRFRNTRRYKFPDGTYSTYAQVLEENLACQVSPDPGLFSSSGMISTKQRDKNQEAEVVKDLYIKPVANSTELLYRTVLPEDKYLLYLQRQKNLSGKRPNTDDKNESSR